MTARPVAKKAAPARTAAAPAKKAAAPLRTARPKSKFTYEEITDEVNSAQVNQSLSGYDGIFVGGYPTFKPREGTNDIRILPRTFDYKKCGVPPHWAYPIFRHTNIGPDRASYLCRKLMLEETCSLCEERSLVGNDQDASKLLRPTGAYVVWLIDRNDEAAGPKLWAMPAEKIERELCVRSKPRGSTEVLQITHPDTGYDVSFKMEKRGDFPQYSAIDIARDESPLSDDTELYTKWLNFVVDHPLNEMFRWFEDSYIYRVYAGQQEESDEELGTDETADEAETTNEEAEAEGEEETEGEEGNGEEGGEITATDVRNMDEDQLSEFAASNELEFDMKDYDNDLTVAQDSLVAYFFPDAPGREETNPEQVEQEEEQTPPPKKAAPVAQKKAAPVAAPKKAASTAAKPPTNSGGGAAATAARLRGLSARVASNAK